MENLFQDVRYGFRRLLGSPGFTGVVVLSLALGIGANTAIFTLINAVMLRILPVKDPEQLVLLNFAAGSWWPPGINQTGSGNTSFSYPSFERFRSQDQIFSSTFGFVPLGFSSENVNVNIDGQVSLADGEMVTGSYFSGLGVAPILGRAFTDEDERPDAPSVAVISYRYWTRQFGRDASTVGKAIALNETPFTIVGVTPPEFFGVQPGRAIDIWVPLVERPRLMPWGSAYAKGRSLFKAEQDWWWLMVMGRLKPGVTPQQARPALNLLFQQSITAGVDRPPRPEDLPHIELTPGNKGLENLRRRFSEPLLILMTLVGLVLLIACANVAALLLSRAAARRKEIGVRLALGASRGRLIRQLLTESVSLAGIGGALGLIFASWGSHALLLLMSGGRLAIALDVSPDPTVLGFTTAVSVLTGILFGLAPALRATRVDVAPALKEGAGSFFAGEGRPHLGLGRVLVIAQVALSLLLLIGAGLFIRTLNNLEHQNFGFNQHNLLLFGVDPTKYGYQELRVVNLYGQLQERLQALPGVRSATLSQQTLVSGVTNGGGISIEGHKLEPGQDITVWWNTVGPRFFETMGIGMLLGRGIEWRDTATSPKVAVVSEAMARYFFGDGNPIGRRFSFEGPGPAGEGFEIVGVVQNAKYWEVRREPPRTAYLPYTQMPLGGMHFEVRTAGDSTALIPTVRRAVQ